jgi:hypothetical protein
VGAKSLRTIAGLANSVHVFDKKVNLSTYLHVKNVSYIQRTKAFYRYIAQCYDYILTWKCRARKDVHDLPR